MSDLFHPALPFEQVAAVFALMAGAQRHTFQVLTKRPGRALDFFEWIEDRARGAAGLFPLDGLDWRRGHVLRAATLLTGAERIDLREMETRVWPLPNVWLGVSVEDQATADERIPHLLATPAAVRFVSYEPALGPVDFQQWIDRHACVGHSTTGDGENMQTCEGCVPRLDWLIVGGESGPGARPCNVAWIRYVVRQCRAAGVPVFVKQLGARPERFVEPSGAPDDGGDMEPLRFRDRKGGDPSEWPEDLRVREFPRASDHLAGLGKMVESARD